MADVFLSYQRDDVALSEEICRDLEGEGLTTFFDRLIRVGETWDVRIEHEIDAASAVVVLWTPASITSRWVRNEAQVACKLRKLYPVLMRDCTPPMAFLDIQASDLRGRRAGDLSHRAWRDLVTELTHARDRASHSVGMTSPGMRQPTQGEICYELGLMHLHGDGAPRDADLARMWLEKALEQGCVLGAVELGQMYHEGIGVSRDRDRALKYVRAAAGQTRDQRAANAALAILRAWHPRTG